ncbi:MAG TPA: transporter substrate-binding domain-containing protein [Pseudomonas sp.]|uniref:substrate-binding periplasmic protein n=1 Tax=Pseudomonas sp. TaxID=306 RepID=UPI002B48E6F7|nr:transporter substrate-binding domain-containing protein [Pseudomonas sp.]HKS13415.1 transporter substrate-binding domain-containing protein [Pseudomonas sp.]
MAIRCVLLAMWLMLAGSAGAVEAGADAHGQVRLVSEEWIDYTNANGTGLAWDVLRKVFEPAGVEVKAQTAPYSRSVGLVKRGEADAWVGSYKDEEEDNLYPRWHFDVDHIYALGLASKPAPTLEDISKHRLAWVRGYDFQYYLPGTQDCLKAQHCREIQRREGILPMLEHNRVDFYIDALTEVDYVLEQASNPALFRRTHIIELPLYLAFGDNERGKALRALFDERMDTLARNGELKPIFDHWKQPYPFGSGSTPH